MANLDEKKKILLEKQQSMAKTQRIVIVALIAILVVVGAGYSYFTYNANPINRGGEYNIGTEVNYDEKNIEMTAVKLESEGEYVSIPIETIKQSSIIRSEFREVKRDYYNGLDYFPLLAYVSPAGRIVVASSLCEPCYATSFHIEGGILVCNVCNTKWRLSDLMGQSGGCTNYPPEVLNYTVKNNKILIKKKELAEWVPRAFKDEMKANQ